MSSNASVVNEAPAGPVALPAADEEKTEQLYNALRRGTAKLSGPDGRAQPLPDSLYAFLTELIGRLNEGQPVYIVQHEAKLSTIEAAAMLGVSRQFLVNLLERGEIPYHTVGTHRRVYAQDLLAYKASRDKGRRKILSDLSQQEMADDIYGAIPAVVTADED